MKKRKRKNTKKRNPKEKMVMKMIWPQMKVMMKAPKMKNLEILPRKSFHSLLPDLSSNNFGKSISKYKKI